MTEITGAFDNKLMLRQSLIFVSLSLLLIVSCDSESSTLRPLDEIPYYVAENFEQITVSSLGRVEIIASKVEAFQEEDKTIFFEAELTEYDSDGKILMEGRAKKIELDGNNDAVAHGDIYVRNSIDETSLEAEKLTWENRERLLSGEGVVSIEFRNEVEISGEGFVADVARKVYEFKLGAKGTFETDNNQ